VVNVREISVHIAKAVIKQAVEEGLATEKGIPEDDEDLEEWIREQMWDAAYRPLRYVEMRGAGRHARGEMGVAGAAAQV
jgi:malate dehydrogenase (oxaloacetate-decarboxylating)